MAEAKQKILFDPGERRYQRKDKIVFSVYSLCLILSPFYLWKSGMPQIADFMFVILLLTYSFVKGFKFSLSCNAKKIVFAAFLLAADVIVTNLVWTMMLTTNDFLKTILFYVFNFIVMLLVVLLYKEYKTKIIEVTYKAILVSLIVQTAILVIGGFAGERMTGSFNNPNQLAYYSLLSLCFLIYAGNACEIKVKYLILGIALSSVLVASSLSKAGIIAYGGLLLSYIFFNNKNRKLKIKFIMAALFIASAAVVVNGATNLIQDSRLVNSVQERIYSIGSDKDDSLAGRGYDRITENPEYLVFGAGEGVYDRFEAFTGSEFHSTLGSLLVSYGIVGLFLFLLIMYRALKNDRFRSWNILLFIMVYGLTHNGIRESFLWVMLALISTGAAKENRKSLEGQ